MIKPEELRIGNYVNYYGTPKLVESVHKNGINVGATTEYSGYNGYGVLEFDYEFKDLEPIPLTEELLVKAGFECLDKNNTHYFITDPNGYKDFYKIHIFSTINDQWHIGFSDKISGKDETYIPTTTLQYLHQLQNLYFALTGTELTIKL